MQTQESLKKKIDTVHDLLSVVKTMKSLAAVNIRSYEQAVLSLKDYEYVVDLSWRALFPIQGRLLPGRKTHGVIVFAIGSDQGMCGQFNEVAADQVLASIEEQRHAGRNVTLWTSGLRMQAAMQDAGHVPSRHFDLPGTLPGIVRMLQEVQQAYASLRFEQNTERFVLVANHMQGQSSYRPRAFQVLPLDETWRKQLGDLGWPGRGLPMAGPGPRRLLADLFAQYLFISLFRSFAQSMAAENAARLAAMQAAEKNILELEDELQAKYRETRQKAITEELFDVISGFEALQEE